MIWIIALLVTLPFSIVLIYGAPYVPTRRKQALQALELLNLKKGDLLLDLGCGDGAVLLLAAKKGIRGIGYELNPYVYIVARVRTWKYRHLVSIKFQNFWSVKLPKETKGVFVFLLDKYMTKLDVKLSEELKRGTKLASYTFEIPGKKIQKKSGAVNLYSY